MNIFKIVNYELEINKCATGRGKSIEPDLRLLSIQPEISGSTSSGVEQSTQ